MNEKTDIELLKLLENDKFKQAAFRALFERYHIYVGKICHRFTKDPELSKDISQLVFLKVHEHYQNFQEKSSFKTWLFAIAYRECLVYLRQAKKIKFTSIDLEMKLQEFEDIDLETEIDLEREQNLALLNQLDPLDKALLLMKYQHNMSIKSIATSWNIGESAVKMRLKRAKTKLQKLKTNNM